MGKCQTYNYQTNRYQADSYRIDNFTTDNLFQMAAIVVLLDLHNTSEETIALRQ